MGVKTEIKKGCLFVRLSGEIDMTEAARFRDESDAVLENTEINLMIVDMAAAEFIDSSGIGALIGRYKKLRYKNGRMCLTGLRENVLRILQMAGVLELIEVYHDPQSAFAAI